MSLAVVRCPACGGASRVPVDALGHMVGCPRCHTPFVATEDGLAPPFPSAPASPPAPKRARPVRERPAAPSGGPRASAVIPIAPPRERQTGAPVTIQTRQAQDHEHDPTTPHSTGGLPLSVMVGFALMPFGIPLLWLIGPFVTGFSAAVSLAVPVSLAVAASALCLGIVYTIDWSGTTRLKGVFILVGLSYLSSAGLYFLKPALMARVQKFFSVPTVWIPVQAERGSEYAVKMPGLPEGTVEKPFKSVEWAPGWHTTRAVQTNDGAKTYSYFFAVSRRNQAAVKSDDAWFAQVGQQLKEHGQVDKERESGAPVRHNDLTGRQWELKRPNGDAVRIVRVFVIEGRVYCLYAEGPGLVPDDQELAEPFFKSFARIKPQ